MNQKIELIENSEDRVEQLVNSPKLDGENILLMKEFLDSDVGSVVRENIFNNAFKSLKFFSNPKYFSEDGTNNLSKILAIGRVQSGKTAFFLSTISLSFDNGYDLVYLIGGTKNTLRNQNLDRVKEYFKNNQNVLIYDINDVNSDTVLEDISNGHKVILVTLKNAAEFSNLGKAYEIAIDCLEVPSLVVDDEGDEYTPGAPKLANKRGTIGRTHDAIERIVYSIHHCTYLAVTATPQANFLISTIDSVSPDYAILIEPGIGYTGGNSFHDTIDNCHVETILDTDDFEDSIPESFMNALYFFIFAICLKRSEGIMIPFSMLVHPSSLTRVQGDVLDKINDKLTQLINVLSDKNNIAYTDTVDKICAQSFTYYSMNKEIDQNIDIEKIKQELYPTSQELVSFLFNISADGREDVKNEKDDKHLYKIYVGGNMLGRGLTIKNLIVSYIYRDSTIQAIDTLYQRARWLGYKSSYFDVCRVYMTDALQQKFIVTVDSENDMWEALSSFLLVDNNIKDFNRIFALNDETGKMILTRKTICKTVVFERVNPGFTYDKSVWFSDDAKLNNLELFNTYIEKHKDDSFEECFSSNDYQTHLIIRTTFTMFYHEFLSKYKYPKMSKFGNIIFNKILEQIKNNEIQDELVIMIMRYKTNEYRSLINPNMRVLKELPQSYNENTKYKGDKNLDGYKDKMHFQIHMVYTDENCKNDLMPLLCFNNPLGEESIKHIRYVTGDNVYGPI